MNKADLRLDWCSHEAAKYAVEHWHYSRTMPAGKLVQCGVWEDGRYVGVVIFGHGANRNAGSPYGLSCAELAELVRVALDRHKHEVSRIAGISIKMLHHQSPGLRLLFSYADPSRGHNGAIYQAMGWIYVGTSHPQGDVMGEHKRSASRRGSLRGARFRPTIPKHKYLMPLDAAMRAQIAPLAKPYPKRVRSLENEAPGTTRRGRCDSDPDAPPSVVQL